MSAQVIQSNTVQNHQAEAVIRKYNTSTECTSLKVLIKIQHVSRSTAYNIQSSHIHDIYLLIQESIQTRNKYNIENKYRPDVIYRLQCHSTPLPSQSDLCPVPDSSLWYTCGWTKEWPNQE